MISAGHLRLGKLLCRRVSSCRGGPCEKPVADNVFIVHSFQEDPGSLRAFRMDLPMYQNPMLTSQGNSSGIVSAMLAAPDAPQPCKRCVIGSALGRPWPSDVSLSSTPLMCRSGRRGQAPPGQQAVPGPPVPAHQREPAVRGGSAEAICSSQAELPEEAAGVLLFPAASPQPQDMPAARFTGYVLAPGMTLQSSVMLDTWCTGYDARWT